jgi:hypothetical protein
MGGKPNVAHPAFLLELLENRQPFLQHPLQVFRQVDAMKGKLIQVIHPQTAQGSLKPLSQPICGVSLLVRIN